MNLRIRPFHPDDEPAALAIEARCVQGTRPALRFERPSFAERSRLYEKSSILAAVTADGRLVGITAWAARPATLHGSPFAAAVHYDLRVDPCARGQGVAQALMGAALEEADPFAEGHYSLTAGRNLPVAHAIERFGRAYASWALEYLCIPVRRLPRRSVPNAADPDAVRRACGERHPADLVFDGRPETAPGYVGSVQTASGNAGASLWSTGSYLGERLLSLPMLWHAAARLALFVPWFGQIPLPGELVRSLHAYDVSVGSVPEARELVHGLEAAAQRSGSRVLNILQHADDPRLALLADVAPAHYRIPYRLLFTGRRVPGPDDRIRVDPRDV